MCHVAAHSCSAPREQSHRHGGSHVDNGEIDAWYAPLVHTLSGRSEDVLVLTKARHVVMSRDENKMRVTRVKDSCV